MSDVDCERARVSSEQPGAFVDLTVMHLKVCESISVDTWT